MIKNKDRFRMYGLVPYNISPIQQGIQFSHALQEYNNLLGETFAGRPSPSYDEIGEDFNTWRLEDKTVIILNGGTSTTMTEHVNTLKDAGIHVGVFMEPDLNNVVTGIVFLIPEQVYNKKLYPDFIPWLKEKGDYKALPGEWETAFFDKYKDWKKEIGERNAFLKEFTNQFKLA